MKKQTDSFVKKQICGIGLWLQVKEYDNEETIAFVETSGPRPGQVVLSIFNLNDFFDVAKCLLSNFNIRLEEITPAKLMKALDINQEKYSSLLLTREVSPSAPLHLKKHHNRSEALLITLYLFKLYKVGAI